MTDKPLLTPEEPDEPDELSVLLAQLRAESKWLQQALFYACAGKDGKPVLARTLEDERDALRAQVEKLEEALKPFAFASEEYEDIPDNSPVGVRHIMTGETLTVIEMRDLRRAYALLGDKQ